MAADHKHGSLRYSLRQLLRAVATPDTLEMQRTQPVVTAGWRSAGQGH